MKPLRVSVRPHRLIRAPARRWLPRRTVRLRLTLLYGSLFLLASAMLLAITYTLVASHVMASVTVRGEARSGKLTIVANAGDPAPPPDKPPAGSTTTFQAGTAASTGPTMSGNGVSGAGPVPGSVARRYAQQAQSLLTTALDRQRAHELRQLLLWSGTALGIMALASIVLGWWMAGRVLSPLRRMTASARQISAHNLHERLALDGPDDELKELGDTVDGLLGRLEGSFEAQRRFVANASHELRTPLTLQRAMIEVAIADADADADALRAVCERVLVAGEQQERLIEALLTLARSERGLEHRDAVDLDHEVRQALAATPPAHVQPAIQVELELAPAELTGDRPLVGRLAANLIDNATRHNFPGGWIRIATGTTPAGQATLSVANSGPVIAPDDIPALLEPFRRATVARTHQPGAGHGLGLSIALAIAEAHDASLHLTARPAGGLDVTATFPAAPQPVVSPSRFRGNVSESVLRMDRSEGRASQTGSFPA